MPPPRIPNAACRRAIGSTTNDDPQVGVGERSIISRTSVVRATPEDSFDCLTGNVAATDSRRQLLFGIRRLAAARPLIRRSGVRDPPKWAGRIGVTVLPDCSASAILSDRSQFGQPFPNGSCSEKPDSNRHPLGLGSGCSHSHSMPVLNKRDNAPKARHVGFVYHTRTDMPMFVTW